MAAEIERKFLVASDAWRKGVCRSRVIRQGYFAKGDLASVRVRVYDRETASLTIKSAREGRSRSEYEYPIPASDALELLLLSQGSVIEKVRNEVPTGDLVWEIDVFSGENEGLVVAEIELKFADQTFARPAWLGAEVTDDDRYYNASLSRMPFRRW